MSDDSAKAFDMAHHDQSSVKADYLVIHLRKLIAFAEAGSQAAAATANHWGQATVSDSLDRLETTLGYKLRARSELNNLGRSLAQRCKPLLEALDQELAKRPHEMRVGITHYAGRNFLASLLSQEQDGAIYLQEADANSLFKQLQAGQLDMVIGATPLEADFSFLILPSGSIPFRIVAHPTVNTENALGENGWYYLLGQCRWAANGVGTATRRRLDYIIDLLSIPRAKWMSQMVAESTDESILLEVVSGAKNTVAVLPWGPALRQAAKSSGVRVLDLPTKPAWPPVTIGVTLTPGICAQEINDAAKKIQTRLADALQHFE